MERYEHTLPTFMCEKTNQDCVTQNAGDVAAQNDCTVTIKRLCGDMTPAPGGRSIDKTLKTSSGPTESTSTTSRNTKATLSLAKSSSLSVQSFASQKSPASNTDTPGRDTGAKVGITIGAVAAATLIACFIYIWRLRKRAAAVQRVDDDNLQPREDYF